MKTDRKYILGLIGCGHMGMAIARGAVLSGELERYQICIYDPSEAIRKNAETEGFTVMKTSKEAAGACHITLLAVTPQHIETVLKELKGADIDVILSIVTGVSIKHVQDALDNVPVIRSMPNTPLQIGEGATALCMSSNCNADDYDFVFQMFSQMGAVCTVKEEQMNDIVAVHGSTPAYIYYFVECILKDAVSRGIDETTARTLLVQTVVGTGKLLVKNDDKPLSALIDEVCTEGGTTIEAVAEMKAQHMDKIIHDADEKCIKRAEQLGK